MERAVKEVMYMSEQSYIKQEHWEVKPATPLG